MKTYIENLDDSTYIRQLLTIELEAALASEITDWINSGRWPGRFLTIEAGTAGGSLEPALLVSVEAAPSKKGASVSLSQWLDDHWRESRDELADYYAEELEGLSYDEAERRLREHFTGRDGDHCSMRLKPLDLFPDSPLLNCWPAIGAEIEKVLAAQAAADNED